MLSVTLKKNEKTGDSYLDIIDLEEVVDISKVKKYSLDIVEEKGLKSLVVKFFDENDKIIDNPPPLMTSDEVYQTLNISKEAIKEMVVNKSLKTKMVNNEIHFIKSQILRIEQERNSAKDSIRKMDEDGFGE